MKKIALFSMALLLTGALGIVLLSSFKGGTVEVRNDQDKTYFKFSEILSPTETNLESETSWQVLSGHPGTNPCNEGDNAPCVIQVDNFEADIDPEDSNAEKIEKLVDYLMSGTGIPATQFVAHSDNFVYQRP